MFGDKTQTTQPANENLPANHPSFRPPVRGSVLDRYSFFVTKNPNSGKIPHDFLKDLLVGCLEKVRNISKNMILNGGLPSLKLT